MKEKRRFRPKRFSVFLVLAIIFFLQKLAFSAKREGVEARVLAWGRNPQSGEVVLVISFRQVEWQKFLRAYGPINPARKTLLLPFPSPRQ